jgi:hypothetical protein
VDPAHPEHQATLQRILAAQEPYKLKKKDDFDQYSADRRTNRVGLQEEENARVARRVELEKQIFASVDAANKEADAAVAAGASEPFVAGTGDDVRNQKFASGYCVCDPAERQTQAKIGKWVVAIMGAHNSETDGINYVSDSLQHRFTPLGIRCFAHESIEWIRVEKLRTLAMERECHTVYEHQMRQDLRSGRVQSRARAANFERRQKSLGIQKTKNPFALTHPETCEGGASKPTATEHHDAVLKAYNDGHVAATLSSSSSAVNAE